MGICIGLLGESQSMSPEDRTIAANLLGDAAAIAADTGTNERARLLRITEAAIGGVAVGENATIAALFQRHKTELERLRRKAASVVEEPHRAPELATMAPATEVQVVAERDARAESRPVEPAQSAEPTPTTAVEPPVEAPAVRVRKRAPGRKKSAK